MLHGQVEIFAQRCMRVCVRAHICARTHACTNTRTHACTGIELAHARAPLPVLAPYADLPGKSTAVGPDEERQCDNPVSKGSLQKVLKTFLAGLVSAPPRVVLVYFAGHGIRTGSKIFLVPANAKLEEGHDLEQMCMSMDEVWKLLKEELDDKIDRADVIFLVILDTCQNLPYNLQKGLSEESLEPDVRDRPKRWALCTDAARGQTAQDGDMGGHSPFNRELLSPQCGLFEENVSFEHALKIACGRLRARGLQEPQLFNINNLDADLARTCLYGPETEISEQHDVFLCFREGGADHKMARALHCRLVNEDIGAPVGRDGERRKLKVFFEPQSGHVLEKHQVADALCSSQIVVLLVSHSTWQGIGQMQTDCPPDDPLPPALGIPLGDRRGEGTKRLPLDVEETPPIPNGLFGIERKGRV